MSYFPNKCAKPQKPIKPCDRDLFGHGPVQTCTTNKCDFVWKYDEPAASFKPKPNLYVSPCPIESESNFFLPY